MPRSKGWEDEDGTKFNWREDGNDLMFTVDGEARWSCTPEDAIDIGTELVKWGKEHQK